jgi:hypothetical protein
VLLLSLLTLFAGPLLYQWIRNGGWLAKTLDRMAVIVLLLIVTLLLLPEIIAQLGFIALILALGGYLFPALLEVIVRRAAHTMHLATLLLALSGLVLHALLDGAGLAGSQSGSDQSLALAIILHRLGIGLMLWMIMQPAFGAKIAWVTLSAVAAATIVGFEFSELIFPLAGDSAVMTIQAIIIGTIIHSLVHRGHMHGLSNASKQQ